MDANKVYYGRCANGEFFSSQNYRQRNAFQIKGFVWEFRMKENIPQSHIYPKASFVLRRFRPILWSYSAYFCPLSGWCRISCFPIHKLARFYVNSSKKPNTSISFTVAFSNIFITILLFLFSVWKAVDILFRTVWWKFYKRRNNTDVYKRVRFLI